MLPLQQLHPDVLEALYYKVESLTCTQNSCPDVGSTSERENLALFDAFLFWYLIPLVKEKISLPTLHS